MKTHVKLLLIFVIHLCVSVRSDSRSKRLVELPPEYSICFNETNLIKEDGICAELLEEE